MMRGRGIWSLASRFMQRLETTSRKSVPPLFQMSSHMVDSATRSEWKRRTFYIVTPVEPPLTYYPHYLKFCLGRVVMEVGHADFKNPHSAICSPLATSLFEIDGVTQIFFGSDFITITKSEDSSWEFLNPEIHAAIEAFYASDKSLFSSSREVAEAEMISKATSSRNMKPLFSVQDKDVVNKDEYAIAHAFGADFGRRDTITYRSAALRLGNMEPLNSSRSFMRSYRDSSSLSSVPDYLLPKYKRNPRRSKSRREPLPKEKPVDNPALISNDSVKYTGCLPNENDRKMISKATSPRKLSILNSDMKPLFSVQDEDVVNKDEKYSIPDHIILKYDTIPIQSKSNWEPLPEKPVDNTTLISIKYTGCLPNENDGKEMELIASSQMVDVSPKRSRKKTAIASCTVFLGKKVFDLVLAKGDMLTAAKIAGKAAAKQTDKLIPSCLNSTLTHIKVDLKLTPENFSVIIRGEAAAYTKVGVEMEALTAVSVAALTVYDMCKGTSRDVMISAIKLQDKS